MTVVDPTEVVVLAAVDVLRRRHRQLLGFEWRRRRENWSGETTVETSADDQPDPSIHLEQTSLDVADGNLHSGRTSN